jgi:hypothetical protein
LEELAPGEHREQILAAARDTLAEVAQNKTATAGQPADPTVKAPDVAPLFQILQTYGDGNTVADIQKAVPDWKHYGLLALAGLPEGQGVPAIIEQAKELGSTGAAKDIFAVQMLAQVAPQHPDASAALLEQAKAGQIPERAWQRIANALAGDQYHYIKDPAVDRATLMKTPGIKTYHIRAANENFYSVPLNVADPAVNLAERRLLVDSLLAATSDATAQAALQQAKARLGP